MRELKIRDSMVHADSPEAMRRSAQVFTTAFPA